MKNMKVSKKLFLSFSIVAALMLVVGIVGIIGMTQINQATTEMYSSYSEPLPKLGKATEMLVTIRAYLRDIIINTATNEPAKVEEKRSKITDFMQTMEENMEAYRESIVDPEAFRLFEEAQDLYETDIKEAVNRIYDLARTDIGIEEHYAVLSEYAAAADKIVENFDRCTQIKVERSAAANISSNTLSSTLLTLIVVLLVLALVFAVFMAVYISGLISKPLSFITAIFAKAGHAGDISISQADAGLMEKYSGNRDETGQLIGSASDFIKRVVDVSKALELVSDGDLRTDITPLSEKDTLGRSVHKMTENLNSMFGEINSSTVQVSNGSKQIADGAQSLAQGSTQQASAVEQLSDSVSNIATQTQQNAGIAREAADLSGKIREIAEKGSQQMDNMMEAVREINDASGEIGKVIKVIDDIAFQTNILALNAAVEAALAGAHGKGFAVVAEEVRSLAAKSAEAAKDTGGLIENSIAKANLGMQIATETAASLDEIVTGIVRSSEIVEKIAQSSDEQAEAITQIHTGIGQVAQVVQLNSATAEESAAASEEMSSQSNMLETLTSRFKLRIGGERYFEASREQTETSGLPIAVGDAGFGKY